MTPETEGGTTLHTWKEIANHFSVSVRTVQMWERTAGLPVRRPASEHGQVSAEIHDLDRWMAQRQRLGPWWVKPAVRAASLWIVPALLCVLVLHDVLEHHRFFGSPLPSQIRVERNQLMVLDADSKELWRQTFERNLDARTYTIGADNLSPKWLIQDLDGDNHPEVLFVEVPAASGGTHVLHCFNAEGRELWRFPSATPTGADLITNLRTVDSPDGSRMVVTHVCRLPRHDGTLWLLSNKGVPVSEYRHEGHLDQMVIEGNLILLGGECRRHKSAELHQIRATLGSGVGTLRAVERVTFERSCVNTLLGVPHRVDSISVMPNEVLVTVAEQVDDVPYQIFYELDRDLIVQKCWASDAFRGLHRRLEIENRLTHGFTDTEEQRLCTSSGHSHEPDEPVFSQSSATGLSRRE